MHPSLQMEELESVAVKKKLVDLKTHRIFWGDKDSSRAGYVAVCEGKKQLVCGDTAMFKVKI